MKHRSSLPKTNPNEDLKTTSRNKFNAAVGNDFVRSETGLSRDKGVDLIVEIKESY